MSDPRNKRVNIKVTADERQRWQTMAADAGLTVADLIRQRLGDARPVNREPVRRRAARRADPALLAALGRFGNNLNQIAKWANTYKTAAEAVQIISALTALEREILSLLPGGTREAGGEAMGFDGEGDDYVG